MVGGLEISNKFVHQCMGWCYSPLPSNVTSKLNCLRNSLQIDLIADVFFLALPASQAHLSLGLVSLILHNKPEMVSTPSRKRASRKCTHLSCSLLVQCSHVSNCFTTRLTSFLPAFFCKFFGSCDCVGNCNLYIKPWEVLELRVLVIFFPFLSQHK